MNFRNTNRLQFNVEAEAENSSARACTFTTLHNTVSTPVFMPVATLAVLRSQDTPAVHKMGFPVLLANTYHLLLRPGTEVFRKFGGIHCFMNWERSVLTDSGGYQIFSLPKNVKITEDGAVFRSYHDGRKLLLSPETSIETQKIINSDIMMAMDWCVPSDSDRSLCVTAMGITSRWAERSLSARGDLPQSLFGIIQGACFHDLRKISARRITSLPFDGYAIGGLAVGEAEDERKDITEFTASFLPRNYPRYLMGVGTPIDLLEAVHRGMDMFDCILPTAMGQQGVAYTSCGRLELRRGVYRLQDRPLDDNCSCPACTRYSRAYIHHLIKTGEYYGSNLVGMHNLTFYHSLMRSMREHILSGTFLSFYKEQKEKLVLDDEESPVTPPKRKKEKDYPPVGEYEIFRHEGGFNTIRYGKTGELLHKSEPLSEVKPLIVRYADLHNMLDGQHEGAYVIWDIGLGSGAAAMAVIMEYENIFRNNPGIRPVKIVSFGRDTDALKLCVKHQELFYHTRHSAPGAVLIHGFWKSAECSIEWHLKENDFPGNPAAGLLPRFIYYNPFPFAESECRSDYIRLGNLRSGNLNGEMRLISPFNSMLIQGTFLAAGFYTGTVSVHGTDNEITVACTSPWILSPGIKLLEGSWLSGLRKKISCYNFLSETQMNEFEKLVEMHPQFKRVN